MKNIGYLVALEPGLKKVGATRLISPCCEDAHRRIPTVEIRNNAVLSQESTVLFMGLTEIRFEEVHSEF